MPPSNLCQLSREKEQTRSSVSGEAGRAAERNGDEKDHVDVEEERRDLFPGDRETVFTPFLKHTIQHVLVAMVNTANVVSDATVCQLNQWHYL